MHRLKAITLDWQVRKGNAWKDNHIWKKDNKSLAFYQLNKLYLAGTGTKIPRSTELFPCININGGNHEEGRAPAVTVYLHTVCMV